MKKYKYLLILLFVSMVLPISVGASSFSLSGSKTVKVGSSVTIKVTGQDAIGYFSAKSSNTSVLSSNTNQIWVEPTGTITFKANKVGKATITISSADVTNGQYQEINLGSKSITINVVSNTTNSSNSNTTKLSAVNNLKSLSIGDYVLNPVFDPGTTTYDVTVPCGTKTINIITAAEHAKATVSGGGEKTVSEGMNSFEIIVTAENGAKKTYTLNVNVEEDPIIVNMNKQDYSIVKQEDAMPSISSYYSSTKVSYKYIVNGEEITYELPAYYSEITKYTLLGLKDEKGNIELYIYDETKNNFTPYNEYNFGNIVLYKIETPTNEVLKDMIKTIVKINDDELEAYQFTEDSGYYLLYGINVNTNNKGWFMYDSLENTLQRYDMENINKLIEKNNQYIIVVLLLSVICFLMLSFLLIFINKSTKGKK